MNKNMLALLCLTILATLPACWCCKPKCKKERSCETRIVYKQEDEKRCNIVTEMVPECRQEEITETVMVPECRKRLVNKTVMVPRCKEVCSTVKVNVPYEEKVYTTVEKTGCKPCKKVCPKPCRKVCPKPCRKVCPKPCRKKCRKSHCSTSQNGDYDYNTNTAPLSVENDYDNNGYTGGVVSDAVNGTVNTTANVVRDIL